jgi:hypothetical protein
MSLDLDMIQKMWEQDSKIDIDNLHTESTNIPILHAKYFELYNRKETFVTKDMNIIQERQIQMFM